MKHVVSLVHRPANAAGLREVLFRAGTLQGMIFSELGMLTKRQGMHAKLGSQLTKRRGILTKRHSALTKPCGMHTKLGGRLTKGLGMDAKSHGIVTKACGGVTKPRSGLTKLDFDPFPPRKPLFLACFQPSTPLW